MHLLYLQSQQETYCGGCYRVTAKILHVQPCSVLNIVGVAVSTERHKVFGRRVLLLPLAWLRDQWQPRRYPSVELQLPFPPACTASMRSRAEAGPERREAVLNQN